MTQATILVTGGNRGIGLALCKRFAREGSAQIYTNNIYLTIITGWDVLATARNPKEAESEVNP
jgi:short-subunit dehydrogenase involved in D-alanine esterification of teichoic acids